LSGETFEITFDSQIYINKRALEYIVQEYNAQKGTRGNLKTIANRIIYLSQHQNDLPDFLEKIIGEIGNLFELDQAIDLRENKPQLARSLLVRVSNAVYVSLFDKSDEALVNDYEEILQQLNSENGELAGLFNILIDDFIHKNPIPVNPEVENEWDENDIPSKLVSANPIPLNSEQLQIISAIKKKNCKYIIVEGPPGTGKSHTITAISFDAILNHQSVLILSDKKEALDVVEDKITETMNKVRFGEGDFQNPILRLGKIGNTYNQILAKATLEKIKTHQRAVKKDYPILEDSISKLQASLKEDIEAEIVAYNNVDLGQIHDFYDLESYYEQNTSFFDFQELSEHPEEIAFLEQFRAFVNHLQSFFANAVIADCLNLELEKINTPAELRDLLNAVSLTSDMLSGVSAKYSQKIDSLLEFKYFSDTDLPKLKSFLEKTEKAKLPLFGYLFAGSKLKTLDAEFKSVFPYTQYPQPHRALPEIAAAVEILDHLISIRPYSPLIKTDFLAFMLVLIANATAIGECSVVANHLLEQLRTIQELFSKYSPALQRLGIFPNELNTWLDTQLVLTSDNDFERAMGYAGLKNSIQSHFAAIPRISYANQKKEIEKLVTTKVTHLLDTRLIEFYTHNQNDAETLRNIIKGKKKFPKEQFAKLKEAFPCILAGIRDYAEYIPLGSEIFDLVIIDEASQVSIAQAFPALIRAKKVLILGDKKQFSNIKSAQARSETNREYLNSIEAVFRKEVSSEDAKLVKLSKFDIKTSILEFFEFVSNYNIQLLKHFRGYKELISYSNRYFYLDSLQVMKIRGKAIDEVIKFTFVENNEIELIQNTNRKEIDAIISELRAIRDANKKTSVGIITPHTNQQKLLIEEISKLPERDFYFDELKLKIMTFDTCQGEERDIIFYSMVATELSDKLWGVFIKSFDKMDSEEDGRIKVQRLNVGFSRAKECVHFIHSRPLDKYTGSIGDAVRHFHNTLEEAKKEKATDTVDGRSKMEPEVLNWFYQTDFWKGNNDGKIEFQPQFEIGKYLKQLDPTYDHPNYKVDFLIVYKDEFHREHKIIIEYDGFREHFKDTEDVNAFNYTHYYSEDDIYRQKILESYGYKFLRINKFNIGENPIASLNDRIYNLIKENPFSGGFLTSVHKTIEGLENGEKKECPKCQEIREYDDFKDATLIRGFGRICKYCKGKGGHSYVPKQPPPLVDKNCPQCGSKMVSRTGRLGKFYGCSTFPRCRGTRRF
jgi:superfamily I DNA and/or RNA helicase/very-short-patch-repair endonuclease